MPAKTVRVWSPMSSVSLTQLVCALDLLGVHDARDAKLDFVKFVNRDRLVHGALLGVLLVLGVALLRLL